MESACVYEQNTVIDELTQGIQMAKELWFNLNSPEARDFLIRKIFSSYENALFILKSGESAGQPMAAALQAPSLPESTTSTGSCFQSEEFVYDPNFVHQQDQNVVSKKRKGSTIVEKAFQGKHNCYNGAQSAETLPPPPLPEKRELTSMHYNHHYHSSLPNPGEMLSNLKTNLSVNTYDLRGLIVPSLCSFPSSQFGFMEEYQQLQIPTTSEDEVLQVYSPPFISPDTSESNYFSEWDSNSSPSLDFTVDQDDSDYYFKVNNSFF
ncbi:WRKY53 [Artemisia annua]|uniref:WRKY53 n=1 Tax=Artemisia annua TaxID=35608 RepID=A0A2U1PPX9_ARTAN|nr:WRKY53 [Artemisia annua]